MDGKQQNKTQQNQPGRIFFVHPLFNHIEAIFIFISGEGGDLMFFFMIPPGWKIYSGVVSDLRIQMFRWNRRKLQPQGRKWIEEEKKQFLYALTLKKKITNFICCV